MDANALNMETVRMDVRNKADVKFLKELAQRMGWTFSKVKRNGLDEAIADYKAGRVHKAKNADDLMEQLMK